MKTPDCYICGNPAMGEAIVEGARVQVCGVCVKYGKPVSSPIPSRPISNTSAKTSQTISTAISHEYSVVDGYGKIIAHAREKMGLTRHQLANTLFITENVIERLEAEHLKPEHKVAQKIEKFLTIKLLEENIPGKVDKLREEMLSDFQGKGKDSFTVADVIDIKTKKK
ncbi:MAG: multiprotein bridging factor aMBF1 [Candidatus Micrarchaeota archaeon]